MNYRNNSNGRYRKGMFPLVWKIEMDVERKVLLAFIILCLGTIAIGKTYQAVKPTTLFYKATGIAEAAEIAMPTPEEQEDALLQKIADCESGIRLADGSAVPGSARQRGKDGRPIMNVNHDDVGSLDVGWAQINMEFHFKETARMGLDVVSSEEDNKKFAHHLYELYGTQPWNASKSCWNR
jgi:hypothetical protein